MGHDIYAISLNLDKTTTEFFYIRFSAFSKTKIDFFYNLIDCQYYNNGVSGAGETLIINEETIKEAFKNLDNNTDLEIYCFFEKLVKKGGDFIFYFS